MSLFAEVLFPHPPNKTFLYAIPPSLENRVKMGSRVLVPFAERMLTGFVVDLKTEGLAQAVKLKNIQEVLDEEPVFPHQFLSFTRKLSEYFYTSWGAILQSSLPPSLILKTKVKVSLTQKAEAALLEGNLSAEEKKIAELLRGKSLSPVFLKKKCRVKNISALLSRMEKKGLVGIRSIITQKKEPRKVAYSNTQTQLEFDFALDPGVLEAAASIIPKIKEKAFSTFYLYGSPQRRHSVYFQLVREVLATSGKVLFLVPEISLTDALTRKFEKRLGERAAILHSQLSEKRREIEWHRIRGGEVDVVVGSRSALFSPLSGLRLIIVDEEHDESHIQAENPSYDARRGAWMRAEEENGVVVFGSDMPSVEAYHRAAQNKSLIPVGKQDVRRQAVLVDEKQTRGLIGQPLREKIQERVQSKMPVIIFLNRRGYASFLVCSRCNHIPKCVHCSISLAYHKKSGKLVCHYCNFSLPQMRQCPECGARVVSGKGIGIEAVEEDLKKHFPGSKTVTFDTDVVRSRKVQEKVIQDFVKGKIDILLGTQLLAHRKGLPPVDLVGILNPESTLTLSDFRASQKTFQLMKRMMRFVTERKKAEVIIQTSFPNHFCIRAVARDDFLSFYNQEIHFRKIMNYPPFSVIVEILFQGENLRTLARKARDFAAQVREKSGEVEVLGPALASVSKLRGLNRVQIVLKAQTKKTLDLVLGDVWKEGRAKWLKSVLLYE